MTTAEARDDLLGLIGIENPSHAGADVLSRILRDENAVLQKLWTMLPQWWTQFTAGERLRAPVPLSGLTVTNSGTAISGGALESWMAGCTIRLEGDSQDNQLATSGTLARPYLGPSSAAASGTVYHDAITLGTGVSGVISPVVLLGECELAPLRGQRDVQAFSTGGVHYPVFSAHLMGEEGGSYEVSQPRDVGIPRGYLVERASAADPATLRLRVSPLPDREYAIRFETRIAVPRITALDATALPVPADMAESIFLPLLRWQFSTWKHFNAEGMKEALKQQHDDAFQLLVKLKPQPVHTGRLRVDPENW